MTSVVTHDASTGPPTPPPPPDLSGGSFTALIVMLVLLGSLLFIWLMLMTMPCGPCVHVRTTLGFSALCSARAPVEQAPQQPGHSYMYEDVVPRGVVGASKTAAQTQDEEMKKLALTRSLEAPDEPPRSESDSSSSSSSESESSDDEETGMKKRKKKKKKKGIV